MIQRMLPLLFAAVLYGQTFEVASIKPSKPGRVIGTMKGLRGGQEYRAENVPVKLMISLMYWAPMRQISGGPAWIEGDNWDVIAKADRSCTLDELRTMFQHLLADQFKLKFHKVIKEGPVYVLSVDKSGPKMKVNETPPDFEIPLKGGPGGVTVATRIWMQRFCFYLDQVLQRDERPVIDRTGLTGYYDFTLSFSPDLPPGVNRDNLPPEMLSRPSLFDALKSQLGLKLEAQKGPVEYYVIDSIEKPAEN